ncbi:hypothetical protein GQ457_16G027770 [Hibiscus cannabinus]
MASTLKTILFFSIFFLSRVSSKLHPLDSLTPSEFLRVRAIVNQFYPTFNHKLSFQYVGLEEPDKHVVKSWLSEPSSQPPPRQAFVILRLNRQTRELIVDLSRRSVVSDKLYRGFGYPILVDEDEEAAVDLVLKHGPFLSSIRRRGLNISEVSCFSETIGWYGQVKTNRQLQISEYVDRAVIPLPKAEGTDYRASTITPPSGPRFNAAPPKPPGQTGFKLNRNVISWGNWKFHLAFDARVGPVISLASIYDAEKKSYRQVMYRSYISDLFVPYQDPTEGWYRTTIFDSGEYGLANFAVPLEPLNDCPSGAVFVDVKPVQVQDAMCIFERHTGDVMWRHSDVERKIRETRPDISIVVRMVSTVANYDYILDWEFKPTGSIKFLIGLTGVLQVKAVPNTNTDQIKEEVYGTLVAGNTIGISHDHFLTYHLDLDVDGDANSFMKTRLITKRIKDKNIPRKSYWNVEHEIAKTESDAKILIGSNPPELLVINPNKETKLGNNVGYRLVPGSAARPLLTIDNFPQIRAAFTNNNVWVTPYNKLEKWASGRFVDRSRGDDTLAVWTEKNRRIENKDIVMWYTVGFHHVTCQEDFPVMPTLSVGFVLKPTNFFEYSPVLKTVPPQHLSWPK